MLALISLHSIAIDSYVAQNEFFYTILFRASERDFERVGDKDYGRRAGGSGEIASLICHFISALCFQIIIIAEIFFQHVPRKYQFLPIASCFMIDVKHNQIEALFWAFTRFRMRYL